LETGPSHVKSDVYCFHSLRQTDEGSSPEAGKLQYTTEEAPVSAQVFSGSIS